MTSYLVFFFFFFFFVDLIADNMFYAHAGNDFVNNYCVIVMCIKIKKNYNIK